MHSNANFFSLSSYCHTLIFHGAQLIRDQAWFDATKVIMSDCLPGCFVNFNISVEIFFGDHKELEK